MITALAVWMLTRTTLSDMHTLTVEGYTVVWQRDDEREYPEGWCELLDPKGRVVVRLEDMMCAPLGLHEVDPQAVIDVDGDGRKEVVLETWSGGAHASMTYQIWSLGKTPRCLLAWDKCNVFDKFDFELRDLDLDGNLEVLTWYDGFAYSIQGAYTGMTPIVLSLKKGRYVENTRSYPKAAKEIWVGLSGGQPRSDPYDPTIYGEDRAEVVEQSWIVDDWVLAWSQGFHRPSKRVLPKCTAFGKKWLAQEESAIRRNIDLIPRRITYPKAYGKQALRPAEQFKRPDWDWN